MPKLILSNRKPNTCFSKFLIGFFCCFFIVSSNAQTAIDFSRSVGMTEGVAGSNGAGAANYSIPIDIPSGVKGMQPEVSISYSSQGGGNGYSGHGWVLSPMSMIVRAGKNFFNNGTTTPVNYTGLNDAFVMDGQRLMLIDGSNGAAGSTYGTEQENFSKIEAIGGNGNSPDWFKVTTKNGTILEYGSDNSNLKTNDGFNTIFWMLRKITDASGNYVVYNYNVDNTNRYFSLTSINYSGNSTNNTQPTYQIVFTYSTKTDYQSCPMYVSGVSLYGAKILDRIDVKKADNSQIRSYTFAYQYRQKKYFLTSVTEAGSDGNTLNPITFSYGENTSALDVTLSSEYGYATDRNFTGDFDGDGRSDIQTYAYRTKNSNETWFKWYQIYDYNAGTIGGKYTYNIDTDILNADVKVMGKDAAQNPMAVSDFDGDGKEDVFLAKFNTDSYNLKGININYTRVSPIFGTTYKKVAYDNLPTSVYGQHTLWKSGGSFFVTGDFDGDGHLDYVTILGATGYTNAYKAFLSTPSKNVFNQEITEFGVGVNGATGAFASNAIAESKSIIPVNFDGDGKTELLVVRNEGSYVISIYPTAPSSGYNYAASVLYFTADIKTDYKIFPADFNGDGNTDLLVRASKNVPSTPWKVFLSTGKSFTQNAFTVSYTIILPGDGYSNAHMLSVGDYDGDGKSDIWHSLDLSSSSSNHVVYYSNGNSFTNEINGLAQSINTQSTYWGGDFNGDGKPDLMKMRNVSNSSFPVKFLMAKPFKENNLLVSVSNLGYLTNFDYALLNGKDISSHYVYSRTEGEFSFNDAASPTPYIPDYIVPAPAMYVVAKILRPNGLGFQTNEKFNYQDLIIHSQGRGFLGFKSMDVSDDMNVVKKTWNTVNTNYSMLIPDVSQVHLDGGGIFTRSRYTISFQQASVSPYSNRRFFMKTDRVHTKNWLTKEAEETLNTYDNYGNVTQQTTNVGTSDDFIITNTLETGTTTTIYGTYAGALYPGFPTSVTNTKTRTGKPQVNAATNYTYTTQGLPQTITENAGTAIATVVTNVYNDFGLPTQTTTNAPAVTTPTITYVYDTKGLFVLEKNIIGGGITKKETVTYDDRWQVPLSKTSTDGLTTTYQYDNFGIVQQTNFADGNSVLSIKNWETTGNARYSILTQRIDGSTPVKLYIDILGREIKTEKRGFSNQWITNTKGYNFLGQLSFEAAPHYTYEPVNNTYYYYDSYGRPTSTNNTTGTVTTTYSNPGGINFTVTTTNALSQWSSKTTDASGKIITSSDNGVDMNFTYDSWGNQLTAASNGQTFVTNAYDIYGRKQSTTDVNAGTILYEYNSLGQLTQQTDAKSNIQSTTYDVFGRVATTSGTQGTTTYTYYNNPTTQQNNDNIVQITGFSGDVRSYQYDALHRLNSESLVNGSTSLTKTYTYDARGNLASTTYPAGFQILNEYDNNDILTKVDYKLAILRSRNLFTANVMNSRGVYTQYETGNGLTKTLNYNFSKEMVTRYYTPGVQDLNLIFEDNTGNLLSRNDAIKNLTETFTYDNYDRLTSAAVNGVQQFSMTYDAGAQGKILQKTDIGNYNYNLQKVHQLRYLTPINGGINPTTVIGTNDRDLTYTSFLKTASITENGYNISYTYGSDRQRLTSTLTQNGSTLETKTYWGNMELLTKNGVTKEIYYIAAGNGLNNIIVKQGFGIKIYYAYTDHLGSILSLTDELGAVVAEQNFDAWGRFRNPTNWTFTAIPARPDWLYRGFTGHEHLAEFALINMNGRMYDPVLGLMLSPDNYTPMPWSSGGYNRYGYANSNPLSFIDPDGNFWHIVIGAAIGGVINLGSKLIQGKIHNLGDGLKAFGVGALAGGVMAATGGAALSVTGLSATSVVGGAVAGFAGSALGSPILGVGNNIFFDDPYSFGQYGKDVLFGAVSGAVIGGTIGAFKGKNIWLGEDPVKDKNIFSLRNTVRGRGQVFVENTLYAGWEGKSGDVLTDFAGNKIGEAAKDIETTLHGSQRLAGINATRGGVLSAEGVKNTKTFGRQISQADGAKVFLHEVSPGRFNGVVEGSRGLITTMENWSLKSIIKVAKNYGWKLD